MKGGKQGRKRTTSKTDSRPAGKRGKPHKGNAKRPGSEPPKPGSRKKAFGWRSTSEE
jgi:hypothetical protein